MDLKIAEERSVSPASQAETDEQDGNILQGMRFLCAEDNETKCRNPDGTVKD